MFSRVDKLQAEFPAPKPKGPNAAAALQEVLGGKYGEISRGIFRYCNKNLSSLTLIEDLGKLFRVSTPYGADPLL